MKYFLLILSIISFSTSSFGQKSVFYQGLSLTEGSYSPGVVLVRMKSEFAEQGSSMKRQSWENLLPGVKIKDASPLSPKSINSPQSRLGKKHNIDITRYLQITFDPQSPIEEVIHKLYETGLVDLVEPDYVHKPMYNPDDPQAASQYHLSLIKAFDAWDISKGSSNIIIAILDSGVELEHPDLRGNIYRNEDDPIDGIDNDGDGYVDNYWGWDFAGSDYNKIVEDNDPNASSPNLGHGTAVAGCASAITDNGVGIAGVGFSSRIMVLKHSADNDDRSNGSGYLTNLLKGVVYAAEHGAHVINASYGSGYYSQIAQDIYRYAALVHDVVIVAAAGNAGSASPNYPSDYDFVLSVAASDNQDQRASFSNYGYSVDITAPGANILTTSIGGNYRTANGTSFSAPIVAGAAALLKTKYPDFNRAQIAELLRITADQSFNDNLTAPYRNRMGRGRLDVYDALTKTSPSIRFDNAFINGPGGNAVKAGEEAALEGNFINFLWFAKGVKVTLTSLDSRLTVLASTRELGNLEMMQKVSIANFPFRIRVGANMPANTEVVLRLNYEDEGGYTDYQYIKILVNPTYFTLNTNLIATTIAGNGRIGYRDNNQKQGIGFVYNDRNMLTEMGVIVATSQNKLVSSVRSAPGNFDDDFHEVQLIAKATPGNIADAEIWGTFDDTKAITQNRLGVEVFYRAYAWQEEPYDKTIILEYEIFNKSNIALQGVYLGLFADWDISQDGLKDKADWHAVTQTGYVYTTSQSGQFVAGIQVLSSSPTYWAIDNDHLVSDNPFGIYDGFSDNEKFRSLSNGIGRTQAGLAIEGGDVSHTVGSGPYTIPGDKSITVAFALHGGISIESILNSASAATGLYESIRQLPRPNPAIVTGTMVNELSSLEIYPNPTKGKLTVYLPSASNKHFSLSVYDMAGRRLLTNSNVPGNELLQLDLSGRTGLYLIEIRQEGKRSLRRIAVH